MKDLEVLYSSIKLGIFLAFNLAIQLSIASIANSVWKDSLPFKYDVLVFSLFLKYHKIVSPVWNYNLFLLSPLVLLTSLNKIFLSLLSEKISDMVVPKLADMLYLSINPVSKADKQLVGKLMEMGFDQERAQEALELHGGNLENAATWLLSSSS